MKRKLECRLKDDHELLPYLKIGEAALRHKTDSLEEKYILGTIDDAIYAKWKTNLTKNRSK